jgi:outer membrane protein assembly factor BamD
MRFLTIAFFSAMMLFTACRNKELVRPGEPLNVAFDKSMALYEKEKFGDAAYGFDMVTRMGRGTNYAQEAQYYLAESYFQDEQYILAASEYERFISYYPQDEKRQKVEYKRAMCYYYQSPRYRLDQSATVRAIELFQLFNTKYPDSEFVIESADRIDELRNKLARKTYESAEFYKRIGSYKAATIYYDQTIDRFPESEYSEKALVEQIDTYIVYADNSVSDKQSERYQLAIDTYEKFLQLFPQSSMRAEAEQSYSEAVKKLSELDVPAEGDELGSN